MAELELKLERAPTDNATRDGAIMTAACARTHSKIVGRRVIILSTYLGTLPTYLPILYLPIS